MHFSEAFNRVRQGTADTRMWLPYWDDDVAVFVKYPDANSNFTAPYLYVESSNGTVPWMPNQIELFSSEWEVWS